MVFFLGGGGGGTFSFKNSLTCFIYVQPMRTFEKCLTEIVLTFYEKEDKYVF